MGVAHVGVGWEAIGGDAQWRGLGGWVGSCGDDVYWSGGGGGKLLGVAHIGGEVGWEGGKLCEWPMSVGDGKPQG